jgi:hypothetical protein
LPDFPVETLKSGPKEKFGNKYIQAKKAPTRIFAVDTKR